jgi:hypothetical protein
MPKTSLKKYTDPMKDIFPDVKPAPSKPAAPPPADPIPPANPNTYSPGAGLKKLYKDKKTNNAAPEGMHSAGTWASDAPVPKTQAQSIADEYALAQEKKAYAEAHKVPNVTAEQIANLASLTPEQQAVANAAVDLKSMPDIKTIGATVGERASVGATGGALAGAGVGSLAAGVGAVPGAIGGGIVGGVGGLVSGAWSSFKDVNSDNIKGIDDNVDNAEYVINNADTEAKKGASYEEVKTMVGDSLAQLDLAERQYKEANKNIFASKTDTRIKLEKLAKYKKDILPHKIRLIELALQNPNPSAVYLTNDAGVANG